MSRNKPVVLIIDDDDSLRRVMEFTLHEAGHRVLTAASGEDGLAIFRSMEPAVVISDIQMPGISGYDVLKKIRAENTETLIVMITAFATVEQAVKAMKDGAFDYITKPFSKDELAMVVERALSFRGLKNENARLRQQLDDRNSFDHLIGISDAMQQVFSMVRRVAATDATVLIGGESGTGKELVARAIHNNSDRVDAPFVPINCAAIPRELLESELFGHRKGSFTGAVSDRIGKFEQADGGTLFLDEVGEMPLDLQPKLLRVLQGMEIEPVGSGQLRKVDVRVVAASNINLEQAIDEKRFREDLYYRLSVVPLSLPALRERKEDIPVLTRFFLNRYADQKLQMADEALAALRNYDWPGNVRELENAIEQMIIMRQGDLLGIEDLPDKINSHRSVPRSSAVVNLPADGYPLAELEKEAVVQALEYCGWNQTKAARLLRVPRHTLVYRMEKYELKKVNRN